MHFEGQTSGTETSSGVKRYQDVNQETFAEKWSTALSGHRANGINAELERDRWAKLRVLVIDACMLTPDHDAGSVRMMAILEILDRLPGHGVRVVQFCGIEAPGMRHSAHQGSGRFGRAQPFETDIAATHRPVLGFVLSCWQDWFRHGC